MGLALSDVHPPQSWLLKSHRDCAYTVSEVYRIIEVGQMSRTGKEGETSSVTAEEGGVHASGMGMVHSWVETKLAGCDGTAA